MIIVTHTDFDGICSAALFLRKYGKKAEIRFATVNEAKKLSKSDFKTNFTLDLPKIGNSINIDHHKSNYENLLNSGRLMEEDRVIPSADSATELVYKYLDFNNDPIATEIRKLANLADTAQLPEKYRPLDIILNMNGDNPEVLRKISTLLSNYGSDILSTAWVLQKYKDYQEIFESTLNKINTFVESMEVYPRILIIDSRGSIPGKLAKEVFRPVFDQDVAVIALIYEKSATEPIRVSFRVSKRNNEQNFYDVSLVAQAFNGGGHKMAAACTTSSKDIPDSLIQELRKIAKPSDEIQYLQI
ncbi:MAG: DHHA1 domain-containing protein [Candidatus Hodarchaeales archaeon]|jgi:nanoRNase/pAp phosphatase (c-di-AMP/oligoRNAs hydrolase)